ncbi:MAG: aldo/keto reductase [Nitrospinae bacterium]|nr:aldo/keto reductase [Nitrospinota bacterium]
MSHVKFRPLGATGLKVSIPCFGGLHLATKLGPREAEKLVRYAVERGINLFDTSRAYMDSEEKIGRGLENIRGDILYCTKSMRRDGTIVEELDASLMALRTGYVDIYMFHSVDREEDYRSVIRRALPAVERARQAGKIGLLGLSTHSRRILELSAREGVFDCLQFPFNHAHRAGLADGLGDEIAGKGIGILAMKPFAGGVLNDPELAVSFIAQYPWAVPLVGFEKKGEIDQIISLFENPPPFDERMRARADAAVARTGSGFCCGCEYCQPCPQGISVAAIMYYPVIERQYGREKMDAVTLQRHFERFENDCDQCRQCESKCPFSLPILEMAPRHHRRFVKLMNGG